MKSVFPVERWAAWLCTAALALTVAAQAGCGHKTEPSEDAASAMASTVRMGDTQTQSQLVSGFYAIEQGEWRWTNKDFSIVLRPPAGAARAGAKLRARLSVPEVSIAKLNSLTLSASINGQALPPETWAKAGAYIYTRDLPGSLLGSPSVKVDFRLDKVMQPAGGDVRQLGLVVTSIGLEPK